MTSKEMEKLLERVYKDIDIFDFNGQSVPRIILTDRRFDEIMSEIEGKPVSVNTNLNILQDGLGHCLLYTSPSPRDQRGSRMPSSA